MKEKTHSKNANNGKNAMTPLLALAEQKRLLQLEYEAEKADFQLQTETIGLQRKVKRGDCWLGVRVGRSYYNSLNQLVVEIYRTADDDIEHNFEYGRQVMFFNITPSGEIKYYSFTATVSYVQADRMVCVIADPNQATALQSGYSVGVQLSFDETTYRLMLEALSRVIGAKNNRLAELRSIFYGLDTTHKFSFAPISMPWLNTTQQHAVNEVLMAKDVAIVHGPPGTGKTTTLVEAIYETLRRESQVMVCAQSNMAVDWISERLMDRGIEVLRVGNPTRVTDKMLSFTYERRFEAHPDYSQLWAVRKAMRELQGSKHRSSDGYHSKMDRLRSRATELEMRINADIFGSVRVVACTLAGSASRVLEGMKFATLFIDEAAQALEAACWIALRRANRVVLAGDHCQLPPTVKSREAMRGGLAKTLMERIVENQPQAVTLLEVQYRMNDDIMRFSSQYFYHGRLKSAPEVRGRSIIDLDNAITWIDTAQLEVDTHEEFVGESFGRINKAEARLTMATLRGYINKIGRQHAIDDRVDIGIISPYRAQVQYLRALVRHDEFLRPLRQSISVNTVDGFQGQERDVVLISLVRDNEKGEIGFLGDLRRMNVAITRARMKLIILGDVATMTHHKFYKQLYDYITRLSQPEPLTDDAIDASSDTGKASVEAAADGAPAVDSSQQPDVSEPVE